MVSRMQDGIVTRKFISRHYDTASTERNHWWNWADLIEGAQMNS